MNNTQDFEPCSMSEAKVTLTASDRILMVTRCPQCRQLVPLRVRRDGKETGLMPAHPAAKKRPLITSRLAGGDSYGDAESALSVTN